MNRPRLFYLDRLRFFVIFLVICLHVAMTYMAYVPKWWYVIDSERNLVFTAIVLVLDVFLMPTMFFLAGYFALPSLLHRGSGAFLASKFRRIGVPWVLGWVLVAPVLAYRSWISLELPTEGYLHFLRHNFLGPVYQQGPYWFLGVLLLFFVLLVPARPLFGERGDVKTADGNWRLLLGFWLGTSLAFFVANLFWPLDTWIHPGYLFVLQPLRVLPYLMTFTLGILAWQRGWAEDGSPILRPLVWLPLALVSGGLFLVLKLSTNVQALVVLKLVNALLHNGFALTAMMALLSLFSLFSSPCDPVGRYLCGQAYSVYWVHMPVVMILAWLCRPLAFSPFVTFSLVVGAGTVLCLVLAGQMKRLPWVAKFF